MLARVLEPEVMDSMDEALEYDAMDHRAVNDQFVADLLASGADLDEILDLGTGTARIPIEIVKAHESARVMAVDLSENMLYVAGNNVELANVTDRIKLGLIDAKSLPYDTGRFSAVISNSIVHHIPDPGPSLAEAVRVTAPGGLIFVRDLMRPEDGDSVSRLVKAYASVESERARQLFDDSLRAALRLDEVRQLVSKLGFDENSVTATSDRHWTWSTVKQATSPNSEPHTAS